MFQSYPKFFACQPIALLLILGGKAGAYGLLTLAVVVVVAVFDVEVAVAGYEEADELVGVLMAAPKI